MDIHFRNHRLFNILTISLPLICFLLSWSAATTTSSSSTPLSSTLSASDILRARGYTLFANSIISSLSSSSPSLNLSGTLLAPPDFAFSSQNRSQNRYQNRKKLDISLLLFHSLPPPPLSFLTLSQSSPKFLPTRNRNLCLFFSTASNAEIAVSTSSSKRLRSASSSVVKIRQPDLYVDDQLTVHGIDGVLDPDSADLCPNDPLPPDQNQTQNQNQSQNQREEDDDYEALPEAKANAKKKRLRTRRMPMNAEYLDHAIRVLKRRGFNFVATALAMRRMKLLDLTSVTVFAPSDRSIFVENSNGFRYDFLHHVVPLRLRYDGLSRLAVGFTAFETLAVNKSVIVEVDGGVVRVDGVRIDGTEVYFNRWIVVFAIPMTLDDAVGGLLNPHSLDLPSPPPQEETESDLPVETAEPLSESCEAGGGGGVATETPTPPEGREELPLAPLPGGVDVIGEVLNSSATPLPGVDIGDVFDSPGFETGDIFDPPSTPAIEENPPSTPAIEDLPSTPAIEESPSTVAIEGQTSTPAIEITASGTIEITGTRKEGESTPTLAEESKGEDVPGCLGKGVEGEDLLCSQHTTVRKLQEADVEECDPTDGKCKLKEKVVAESRSLISKTEVNIADDLFFYA